MNKYDLTELYNQITSRDGMDFCAGLDPEIADDDELYEILEELRSSAIAHEDACQKLDDYYGKQLREKK